MASHTNDSSLLLALPLLFLLLLSSPTPSLAVRCNVDDKKALLAIKAFWGNPKVLSSWIPGSAACCGWTGVLCNDANRVRGLFVLSTNLAGKTIPPAVADLPFLDTLNLRNTGITGPIPSSLSGLRRLQEISLSNNRLTGRLPAGLASLPVLNYLDLTNNRISGSIPEAFGKLPRGGVSLLLAGNKLEGPVPRSLGAVDFNALDLSRNRLSGDASSLFRRSEWKFYYTLKLSQNLLEFDLSKVGFPVNLNELDISSNRIYGRLPRQLAEMRQLSNLNVSSNRLCGEIPTGGRMDSFDKTSYLNNLCLCGKPLPPCKKP